MFFHCTEEIQLTCCSWLTREWKESWLLSLQVAGRNTGIRALPQRVAFPRATIIGKREWHHERLPNDEQENGVRKWWTTRAKRNELHVSLHCIRTNTPEARERKHMLNNQHFCICGSTETHDFLLGGRTFSKMQPHKSLKTVGGWHFLNENVAKS